MDNNVFFVDVGEDLEIGIFARVMNYSSLPKGVFGGGILVPFKI